MQSRVGISLCLMLLSSHAKVSHYYGAEMQPFHMVTPVLVSWVGDVHGWRSLGATYQQEGSTCSKNPMLCQQSSHLSPQVTSRLGSMGSCSSITTLGVFGGHISPIQDPRPEYHMSTTNPFARELRFKCVWVWFITRKENDDWDSS